MFILQAVTVHKYPFESDCLSLQITIIIPKVIHILSGTLLPKYFSFIFCWIFNCFFFSVTFFFFLLSLFLSIFYLFVFILLKWVLTKLCLTDRSRTSSFVSFAHSLLKIRFHVLNASNFTAKNASKKSKKTQTGVRVVNLNPFRCNKSLDRFGTFIWGWVWRVKTAAENILILRDIKIIWRLNVKIWALKYLKNKINLWELKTKNWKYNSNKRKNNFPRRIEKSKFWKSKKWIWTDKWKEKSKKTKSCKNDSKKTKRQSDFWCKKMRKRNKTLKLKSRKCNNKKRFEFRLKLKSRKCKINNRSKLSSVNSENIKKLDLKRIKNALKGLFKPEADLQFCSTSNYRQICYMYLASRRVRLARICG